MTVPTTNDPFVARLFRYRTGLRPGGVSGKHEVLATYHTRAGETPFAICRDGLLLNPDADARFVPFAEVEDAGYYNPEMVKRAKTARIMRTEVSEPLSVLLRGGEVIDLPVEVRDDGMADILTIAKIIHERAAVFRLEARRASDYGDST